MLIEAGKRRQLREITVGGSFLTSPRREAHFGLGPHAVVDLVRVTFPSGWVVELRDVAADQRLQVLESRGRPPGWPRKLR